MAPMNHFFVQGKKRAETKDELAFVGLYVFLFVWTVLCTVLTLVLVTA